MNFEDWLPSRATNIFMMSSFPLQLTPSAYETGMNHITVLIWIKYNLDRSTIHPKFDLTGAQTRPPDHDSTFYVTETPALTTWPSATIFTQPTYSTISTAT